MGKLGDFLTGTKILEEAESPINGRIRVMRGLAFGTYIQVDGLTQSGGILKNVWNKSLRRLQRTKNKVQRCLILGLGGGTVAGLVREYWPEAKITGVDLDLKMVEMGRKYLNLDKYEVEVVIGDAFEYLDQSAKNKGQRYDLILVDLYIGREFPEKFESEHYIQLIRTVLASGGKAIFNRLYYGEKRSGAVKFGNKLEKIFNKVDVVYPEANVMYIAQD